MQLRKSGEELSPCHATKKTQHNVFKQQIITKGVEFKGYTSIMFRACFRQQNNRKTIHSEDAEYEFYLKVIAGNHLERCVTLQAGQHSDARSRPSADSKMTHVIIQEHTVIRICFLLLFPTFTNTSQMSAGNARETKTHKMKTEERSCYQFFLECSSFARLTPNTLVTSALNSNVDEFRIYVAITVD